MLQTLIEIISLINNQLISNYKLLCHIKASFITFNKIHEVNANKWRCYQLSETFLFYVNYIWLQN